MHLAQQRDRFHRRPVVRVQHQRLLPALLAYGAPLQQRGGVFSALLLMHFPIHPFAAVDILYLIEVVILTANGGWQVGDVPRWGQSRNGWSAPAHGASG